MPLLQPYADRHVDLKGAGDQRPTAEDIVRDEHLVDALPDIVILITGCTSGVGVETARALYLTGAKVYITARDMARGSKIAQELSTDPVRQVQVIELSLDSLDSVRTAASDFLKKESRLNILINNAGVMACPQDTTRHGFELQFGTNHLGHFLLFHLLQPALLAAAAPSRPSRVVSLSSTGHRLCPGLSFDDLDFSKSDYSPFLAYGRSKLANIYFANELDRRYKSQNLRAFSVHPGSIKTPLQRHVDTTEFFVQATSDPAYQAQLKSVAQGAATSVWAAVSGQLLSKGGIYLEDVGEAGETSPERPGFRPGYGVKAYSPDDERKLWEVSKEMCGIKG